MANIDIPMPADLKALLEPPKCVDLSIKPINIPSITLPTGGSLKGLADVSKGIPTDCSLSFSLLLQIGPILASMECLLKILKLLGPLLDLVTSPPPTPAAIKKVVDAAADLAPCLLLPTPANMIPFVRDLLCLILKLLKCAVGSLKSVAQLMQGLSLSLDLAAQEGNEDMMATIKCAQQNAQAQASSVMTSIEPLAALLELAGPVLKIAGVGPISLKLSGSADSADALLSVVNILENVVEVIEAVIEPLGGCS